LPQGFVELCVVFRARPGAPGLVSAVEAVDLGKSEIAENSRVFATGIAVIAVDQDRPALCRSIDDLGKVGRGDVLRAVYMSLAERFGVANVEHQHVIAADHALGLVDADTPEFLALSHGLAPSSRPG